MAGLKETRDKIRFGGDEPPAAPVFPLRLIVIAGLACGDDRSAAPGAKMRVDKDSFNEVLRTICPRIRIELASDTSSSSPPVVVEFPVQDLKSFAPAQLVGAPLFRDLVTDRSAAADLRDGKMSADEFRRRLQSDVLREAVEGLRPGPVAPAVARPPEPRRPAAAGGDDILDSILGMVDAPGSTGAAAPSSGAARVQSFIEEMFGGNRPSAAVDRGKAARLVTEIEATIASRMNDVLGHPELRRLEAGWRGLKFLIDRTEFRDGIELEIIPATKHVLVPSLEALLEDMESGAPGYDAVLAAIEFGNTPEDLDILRRAAEVAAEMKAPLLVSVGASFFGKSKAAEVALIPHLKAHLDAAEFVKWNSFREIESSRWLGVGFNRFLLRDTLDPASARLSFPFHEKGDGLWGDPVWAIGALIVSSFSRSGWCGHITGVRGGGALEDLPVRGFELPSGEVRQIPLESVLLRGRENDFYEAGFLALQCGEDQDIAALLDSPTAHRPERYSDARETEISRHRSRLSYQLVAGRIARFVEGELGRLGGSGLAEIERDMTAALRRFLAGAASDAVQVRLSESRERRGRHDLAIRIRPGPSILPLQAGIDFDIPLRGV